MSGITSSTALWYASRATGIVSLVLLTAVVVLGILVNRQGRLPGLPRFAVTGLHRNLSLLAVGFVAVHVADGHRRPVRHHRPGRGSDPARLAVQASVDRARRGVPGLDDRPDRDQPGAGQDRPPDLAGGALAGLCVLAGGARAQHRQQRRPAGRSAACACRRMHARCGRRRRLADAAHRSRSTPRARRVTAVLSSQGRCPMTTRGSSLLIAGTPAAARPPGAAPPAAAG